MEYSLSARSSSKSMESSHPLVQAIVNVVTQVCCSKVIVMHDGVGVSDLGFYVKIERKRGICKVSRSNFQVSWPKGEF